MEYIIFTENGIHKRVKVKSMSHISVT